jgi:hypothetical protein
MPGSGLLTRSSHAQQRDQRASEIVGLLGPVASAGYPPQLAPADVHHIGTHAPVAPRLVLGVEQPVALGFGVELPEQHLPVDAVHGDNVVGLHHAASIATSTW